MKDQESWLELGFVLLAAGVVTGLAALALGQTAGAGRRRRQAARPAPTAGSVPPGRHQHTTTVAAR